MLMMKKGEGRGGGVMRSTTTKVRGAWEGLFTPPLLRGSNCLFFFFFLLSGAYLVGVFSLLSLPFFLSLKEGIVGGDTAAY